MREADLECRRFAAAQNLVTVVLISALSFDCCVVPPAALTSHAQELDEMVDASLPMPVGQDRLEYAKECACPRMLEGGSSAHQWLSWHSTWRLPPAWRDQLDYELWQPWDSLEQPEMLRTN